MAESGRGGRLAVIMEVWGDAGARLSLADIKSLAAEHGYDVEARQDPDD